MRRFVALSSTTSTGRSRKLARALTPVCVASRCRANGAVKQNVLPCPWRLSSQRRPPISFTSCDEIARPSPVPPYLRVIERSACSKASKINCCFSGGMPMPVSVTAKRSSTCSLAACLDLCMKHDLATLCEFDGVADEVEDDLAQAARITHQRIGDVRRGYGRQVRAPSAARAGTASSTYLRECPADRTRWSRDRAFGLQFWRSPGCR